MAIHPFSMFKFDQIEKIELKNEIRFLLCKTARRVRAATKVARTSVHFHINVRNFRRSKPLLAMIW